MNRNEFQTLAEVRLAEAKALLDAGYFDGAYYLAGYAVECALKACIAKQTREYDFPPDRRTVEEVYSHDIERLLRAAQLRDELLREMAANVQFSDNWSVVVGWSEISRYQRVDRTRAIALYNAVSDPLDGVMRWLRLFW